MACPDCTSQMSDRPTQVSDEEKQEILAALRGEVAIPVYATEEGVKRYFIGTLT